MHIALRKKAGPAGVLILFLLAAVLAGCATGPGSQPPTDAAVLLHGEAFPGAHEVAVETRQEVFYLDTPARVYLDRNIGNIRDSHERGRALVRELFNQAELNLTYQSNANTTATETFHQKSANCLSMSILAYAMAEYVGFDAKFQEVDIPEYWERRDGYSLMNRHVNVLIKPRETLRTMLVLHTFELEVDFQPMTGLDHPPKRAISKLRALAMFYNNKAVDALLAGEHGRAYAYLEAAVRTDPELDMALVNLGLLYSRTGHPSWAEETYRHALRINPTNSVAADSLARLMKSNGREEEARTILAKLERERKNNPYFLYIQGEEAYDAGNWNEAISFFRRAINRKPDVHGFHFGIARAYYNAGKTELAELHLKKAERYSSYSDLREKYSNKLMALGRID